MKKILLLSCVLVFLTGCQGIKTSRGFLPKEKDISLLQKARTRTDIENILGEPSFISADDSRTFFYTSYKRVRTAFMQPRYIDYYIISYNFDAAGNITKRQIKNIKDKEFMEFSDDGTPVKDKISPTLWREIFGNVNSVTPGLSPTNN